MTKSRCTCLEQRFWEDLYLRSVTPANHLASQDDYLEIDFAESRVHFVLTIVYLPN
jgi:hypothetical protein